MKKALIILSGGQDSTTCLAYYKHIFKDIHCITFNYHQLNRSEIDAAFLISKKLGIKKHQLLNIKCLKDILISSLTDKRISVYENHPLDKNFPSTFVPGRNILFLTFASIYAYHHKIDLVVLGVNEIDFSGYPDCRSKFIKDMNHVIKTGMHCNIKFVTPLMNLNKSEIWALSDYCNVTDIILNDTVTCYNGVKGSGCQLCKACLIRIKSFNKWKNNPSYYTKSMKIKMKLF